jgi:6-pyruvoyltetrahydropterin/6-carboxytetrahydropterin synthase
MYLTISKRFEFSSSHRYWVPGWSDEQNRRFYGPRAGSTHGYGNNFTLFTVFHGDVEPHSGMVINVTTIKERVNDILSARYDHKFLNADTALFQECPPTPENIALWLLHDVKSAFQGESAQPVVCHLMESDCTSATAYSDGVVERHFSFDFSAARRTVSPHLSDEENRVLFGIATGIHGHGYRLRVTIDGPVDDTHGMIVPPTVSDRVLSNLHQEMDHRYLNEDVPGLRNNPITTEILVKFIFDRLRESLPVARVHLAENPRFFAEHHNNGRTYLGIESSFHAAHRLNSPLLSEEENAEIYDKCNNPSGHGHLYRLETTLTGDLDVRSGTLYPLDRAYDAARKAIAPWRFRHLDNDTEDFRTRPSTAENMIFTLWPRLQERLENRVWRARLWETPNNRFTLRKYVQRPEDRGEHPA